MGAKSADAMVHKQTDSNLADAADGNSSEDPAGGAQPKPKVVSLHTDEEKKLEKDIAQSDMQLDWDATKMKVTAGNNFHPPDMSRPPGQPAPGDGTSSNTTAEEELQETE